MKWSAWDDGDGGTRFQPGEAILEPGSRILMVFDAPSWNAAMQQYHEWQGWEPYKPMLDENGNEYPEDNEPLDESMKQSPSESSN